MTVKVVIFSRKSTRSSWQFEAVQPANRLPKGIAHKTRNSAYVKDNLMYTRALEVTAQFGSGGAYIRWSRDAQVPTLHIGDRK